MKEKSISHIGDNWEEYRETLLTPKERAKIEVKVARIGERIRAKGKRSNTIRIIGIKKARKPNAN